MGRRISIAGNTLFGVYDLSEGEVKLCPCNEGDSVQDLVRYDSMGADDLTVCYSDCSDRPTLETYWDIVWGTKTDVIMMTRSVVGYPEYIIEQILKGFDCGNGEGRNYVVAINSCEASEPTTAERDTTMFEELFVQTLAVALGVSIHDVVIIGTPVVWE